MVMGFHKSTGTCVSIKVMYDESPNPLSTCLEAKLLQSCNASQNIVKHVENIKEGLYVYMITIHMSLGNLSKRMATSRIPILSEPEMAYYAGKVVGALDDLHKAGFVHNNIRPDAIFLHSS